ncbi:shikimate dehydrogenase [Candidatus Providencia siddallii]|uniref:Shikimate dehydrogenase (NADP(+)) n=1 Tax=Candidatus Providencia siddallii TaxID=1715285 RepID=A0ABM9NNQ9_9GAMM
MKIFALFGNPIIHSKSPFIYKMYAKQIGISIKYKKISTSKKNFKKDIINFFLNGGHGANITSPFKEIAFKIVSKTTKRAQICGSVNTIIKLNDNFLLGDNTDGIGLLLDLKQNNYIHTNSNILILGAGGSTRGILHPLLNYGCNITLINRTFYKANKLIHIFTKFGNIKCKKNNENIITNFDLIINATSSSMNNEMPKITTKIFKKNTIYYDLFYQNKLTPFLKYAKNNKANKLSDGLGMLVWQAAISFKCWFGKIPDVIPVLLKLKKNKTHI